MIVRVSLLLTLSFPLISETSSIWRFPCGSNERDKEIKGKHVDFFRTSLEDMFTVKYDCILDGRARIVKQMSLKPQYFEEGVFLDLVILHGKMGPAYSYLKWDEWMNKLRDWAVRSKTDRRKKLEVGCAVHKKTDYEILCLLQTHGSVLKRLYQEYHNVNVTNSSSNGSKLE